MVYKWKPNSRIKLDPQAAGARLEKIRVRHGGELTPHHVVQDARSTKSPLHPHFEWDDIAAAESWRREQASHLIRHLVVEIEAAEGEEPRTTRAFVSLKTEAGDRYDSIVRVMSDAEKRAQVVARALAELDIWRERYRDYEELADLFAALDATAPQLPKAA